MSYIWNTINTKMDKLSKKGQWPLFVDIFEINEILNCLKEERERMIKENSNLEWESEDIEKSDHLERIIYKAEALKAAVDNEQKSQNSASNYAMICTTDCTFK